MALADEQRTWLNTALSGKGRIKSASIKKQHENYVRRRLKVAEVFDKMPHTHSNYTVIEGSLKEADSLAKGGDFKGAYKYLDRIKALAKATDAGTSGQILDNELRQAVELIEKTLDAQIWDFDAGFTAIDHAKNRFNEIEACSDKADMKSALEHRKAILVLEPDYHARLDEAELELGEKNKRRNNRDITGQISRIRKEFDRLNTAGQGAVIGNYATRVDTALATLDGQGRRYKAMDVLKAHLKTARADAERILIAKKSVDSFPMEDFSQDNKIDALQGGLKPVPAADVLKQLMREEDRMKVMRAQYLEEKRRDNLALQQTGTGHVDITPPPAEFESGDLLDALDTEFKGKPKEAERARAAKQAGEKMSEILKSKDTPQSVLLDLMTKTKEQLVQGMVASAFPGVEWKDVPHEQQLMLHQMADEMVAKINADAPNKVDTTGETVMLGGVEYKKLKTLKSGGLGTANLFEDPVTGKKMVMKTPNRGNEDAYEDLLKEMKIMNRAQEGAQNSPNKGAIPELYGAARGEDGSMHMLMEFIDGGDMSEVSGTVDALASSGILPPAARAAMQSDMIGKAATALGELQRQGLIHRDIKGLNVMMTKEGEVKIIDYGESAFLKEDGEVDYKNLGNVTPGYSPPKEFGEGASETQDNYAIGSMLLKMVGQNEPDFDNELTLETGALGRLIQALHEDPDKRVSLEGLAQSAFMTSTEKDYGPEAMTEMRSAATEFAQDSKSIKSGKTMEELEKGLGGVLTGSGKTVVSVQFGPEMAEGKKLGLDDAQELMAIFDNQYAQIMRELQSNTKRLTEEELALIPPPEQAKAERLAQEEWLLTNRKKAEELQKARAFLQCQVIDEMLDNALTEADFAFEEALKSPMTSVICAVNGEVKSMTLAEAVKEQEPLVKNIEAMRSGIIKWLETAEGTEEDIQLELDERNKVLVERNTEAEKLEKQIIAAAGPEAKLRFSKAKLDKATIPFGPPTKRRTQQEVEADAFKELQARWKNAEVNEEVKEKVS